MIVPKEEDDAQSSSAWTFGKSAIKHGLDALWASLFTDQIDNDDWRLPPINWENLKRKAEIEELREVVGNIAQSYEELALRVALIEDDQGEKETEDAEEPNEGQSPELEENTSEQQEPSQRDINKDNGEQIIELMKAAAMYRQLERKLEEAAKRASSLEAGKDEEKTESKKKSAEKDVTMQSQEGQAKNETCQTMKCLTKGAVDLLLEGTFSVFGNPIKATRDGTEWARNFLEKQAETLSQIFGGFLFLIFLNIVFYVYIKGAQVYKKIKEIVKIILGLPLIVVVQQVLSEVVGFTLQLKKEKKDKGKLEKEIKKLGDGMGMLFEEIQRNRQENLITSKEIEERFQKNQERNMDVYRGVRDDLRRFQAESKKANQEASSSNQEKRTPIKCGYCGRFGHLQEDCRLRMAREKEAEKVKASTGARNKCWFCGKEGHVMANCPKNKSAPQKAGLWGRRLSKIDEVPEKDAASTSEKREVNAVEEKEPVKLMYTPVWINGMKFERCLVDQGSQPNLVPLREMTRTGIPFVSEINWVRAYDNTIGKAIGRFTANLKIGSVEEKDVEFLVSDTIDSPFVGLGTLRDMGMDIRCKQHELHHQDSGEIIKCSAITMEELEKGRKN